MKISRLTLIFEHVTWTSIRVIYSLKAFLVPSLATFYQRSRAILSWLYFFKDQQFDPDLWPCDLKIIQDHLLARGIHYTKFATFWQSGQEILSKFFFSDSHFDLNLWPCDLKINKGHLLSSGIHCTKLRNFLAKGPGQKILSGHHLYKDQQFNLDLWPCDLKINYYREHLPS